MTPRKPIKRVSRRQARRNAEYARVKKKWLMDTFGEMFPICQFLGCWNMATEIHHSRGKAGSLLTDTRHWFVLCRDHHQWTHSNVDHATKLGLFGPKGSWNDPEPLPESPEEAHERTVLDRADLDLDIQKGDL